MLSVIIPTEGVERTAVATLAALVPGAAAGVIQEVLLVDRGGSATIARVADVAGCRFVPLEGSRAAALALGARQARARWLLFLHAGAVLDAGWTDETAQFIGGILHDDLPRAGIFRYAASPSAARGWRGALAIITRAFTQPVDQGLLIARDHYDGLGGYDAAGSEAVLLRRLGSSRTTLRSRIVVG